MDYEQKIKEVRALLQLSDMLGMNVSEYKEELQEALQDLKETKNRGKYNDNGN